VCQVGRPSTRPPHDPHSLPCRAATAQGGVRSVVPIATGIVPIATGVVSTATGVVQRTAAVRGAGRGRRCALPPPPAAAVERVAFAATSTARARTVGGRRGTLARPIFGPSPVGSWVGRAVRSGSARHFVPPFFCGRTPAALTAAASCVARRRRLCRASRLGLTLVDCRRADADGVGGGTRSAGGAR